MPDTFTMVLDMDRASLGFRVRDQWLGWAVTGLKSSGPLFPIASTVWGHCEVSYSVNLSLQGIFCQKCLYFPNLIQALNIDFVFL